MLLYEENTSENLDFLYDDYPRFNLQEKNEADCKGNFRDEKQISRLVDVLEMPAVCKCDQGTICERIDGLCILLKRLSFPCRFSDMIPETCDPILVTIENVTP